MARTKKRTTEISHGMIAIIMKSGKLLYISCSLASMLHHGKISLHLVQRWWIIRGIFFYEGGDMEMGKSMARGSKGNLARKA